MFDEMRRNVADALKKRDVRNLVYFHCDHFEPWRGFKGNVSEANASDILDFSRVIEGVDYAKKLTLFYKSNNYICVSNDRKQVRADGDEIGIAISTANEINIARVAMEHIAHNTAHEIQVHYHHEFFTGNDKYCLTTPATREFFLERNTPELDRKRWEIGLTIALETIRLEANIPLENWFFVHGNWALNGSDRDVCTITDEIQRLRRLGCLGDFTFPAGRPNCDPRYAEPVFVLPIEGLKSYDLPEAEAVPAYGNGTAADEGKFFIWSSAIKATSSSLDYYSAEVRKRLENAARWLTEIVEKSVVKDGTLFFKTHSHSMYVDYFEASRRPIPPHLYPGVQNLLCTLFDGAADAGIEVTFETVGEVYRRFIGAQEPAAESAPPPAGDGAASSVMVVSSAPALDVDEAEDQVNSVALTVMRKRINTLGSQGAGAYRFYEALIEREQILRPHELRLAEYLVAQVPPEQPIVQVRCGIGGLVLLLAAVGREAIGIEGDRRRVDSFGAIRDALGEKLPMAKTRSRVISGNFSSELANALPRNAVLVFTDTVCGLDLDAQRAIIAAAANFSSVLFDAELFFTKRTGMDQIEQLLGLFEEAGFGTPSRVLENFRGDGRYYRVTYLPRYGAAPTEVELGAIPG